MKIRLLGQRAITGGGIHFSNFADSLKKIVAFHTHIEEVDVLDASQLSLACQTSQADDVNIFFFPWSMPQPLRGINIVWAIFEATVVPQVYINFFISVNAALVWAPSQWGKEMLCKAGVPVNGIDVIPEGIDPNIYHPYHRATITRQAPYKFLIIGKFEERKGYKELLRAFRQAFDNSPDVLLVCKTDHFMSDELHESKKNQFLALIESSGLTNIAPVWARADSTSMLSLYSQCDAFVFPTKAEGWGLPLIEAIACGLPVITTRYSGHTEFIQHLGDSLITVDYDMVPIVSEDPGFAEYSPAADGNHGLWASPKVDSITHGLRYCYENRERLAHEAIRASSIIRSRYSWDQSAIVAMDSLITHGFFKIQ